MNNAKSESHSQQCHPKDAPLIANLTLSAPRYSITVIQGPVGRHSIITVHAHRAVSVRDGVIKHHNMDRFRCLEQHVISFSTISSAPPITSSLRSSSPGFTDPGSARDLRSYMERSTAQQDQVVSRSTGWAQGVLVHRERNRAQKGDRRVRALCASSEVHASM